MTEILTQIDIDAAPAVVWEVLSDFGGYAAWNPMVIDASGTAVVGTIARLRFRSSVGLPLRFRVRITRAEPGSELRWIGNRLSITGDHYFRLEPIEGGGTRLVHGQVFSGRLTSLAAPLLRRQTPVFERFNRALKQVAEARPAPN